MKVFCGSDEGRLVLVRGKSNILQPSSFAAAASSLFIVKDVKGKQQVIGLRTTTEFGKCRSLLGNNVIL